MNILEQEDIIKGLPDQALMQEAQMPSGQVPQYLVVSEIQRRSDMRKRYKAGQEQMPQATVKEQVMQEGIMGAMPQMPPQMAMAPQMPQRMPQMPPQGIQQAMPPQMMFGGGVVRMKKGGYLDQQLDLLGKKLGGLGGAIKGLESGGDQEDADGNILRSEAGALGVMQLMPKTAALPGYNIPSIFNLARNAGIEVNEDQVTFDTVELDDGRIRKIPTAEATAEAARLLGNKKLNELMGLKYLDGMVNTFSGRAETPEDLVSLIGIAYNAGPEVAKAWDGNPERLNDETRRYIDRLGDDPDAVSFARIAGGFASDEPEEGSPEAQARVVEAIQRRRAERPAPPSQPELSFVTPQEGPRERRESAQRGMDMMLDQLDQNDRQRRIEAVPELSKLYQDMGIDPIQASNFALGIGPRGPVNPFGAPPADRSGVAATGQNVFGTGFGDVRDAVSADPVSDGIASQLAKRTVDRYTDYDPVAPVFSEEGIFRAQGGVDSGVATLPTNQEIADARAAYMGRTGDARMQATDSAEVQSEPRGIFSQTASQLMANADASTARGLIPGLTNRDAGFGTGMVSDGNNLGRTIFDNVAGYVAESEFDPRITGDDTTRTQVTNQLLGIGPSDPVNPQSVFGTSSSTGRFGIPNAQVVDPTGSEAPPVDDNEKRPVDANGVTPETQIVDTLVEVPSWDRSNPVPMDMNSPDYDLAEVIARNQGIYDPFKFDLTKSETEPKPTPDVTPPEFNITDILDESRRMNQANILMQLGAGIAAGDVSKGLSAAGAAAASGAKEIRDLDMRSRLAKFQAGREDQKRETAASQFDRQMTLLEEKVENAAAHGGAAKDAALIRVLGDEAEVLRQNLNYINKEEDGGTKYQLALDRLERLQQTLYSLGGIKMPTGDVGGAGITDFKDVTGSQAIVGG